MTDFLRIDTLKYADLLADLPKPAWKDILRAADQRPRNLPSKGDFDYTNPTEDLRKAEREGEVLARRLSDRSHSATVVAMVHWDNRETRSEQDLPDLFQAVVRVISRSGLPT